MAGALLIGACASSSPVPTATVMPTLTPVPTQTLRARPPATVTPSGLFRAPIARRIALNTPVESIYAPDGAPTLYVFVTEKPQRVGVEFVALDGEGALSLSAQIYDSEGALVSPVTEVVGQPSLRHEWDLLDPGEHTVQVFGLEAQARAFSLTVVTRPLPKTGGGAIRYGQSRSGEILARGQRDRWTFAGAEGDRIAITLFAATGDAVLELRDSGGELIAQADDDIGSNPALSFVLPADGAYAIVVRMFNDDTVGAYRLALERLSE